MGYTPASNLTSTPTLAHLVQVFYRKRGLDRLQKKFVFREACMDDMLPKQNGKTVQWFRYTNLAANTTPAVEGTVGTGVAMTSRTVSATVSQYTAYITVGDLLQDTAIDPIVQNASELLSYSGGLSVDTITRTIIDAEQASTDQALLGAFARVADLRNSRHQLQAVDVEPMDDGNFFAICHPFVSYDIVNDPAAAGFVDINKYQHSRDSAITKYEDRGQITIVGGCRLIESTNVATSAGPPATYRMYVFGKNGVGAVDLEGRGPNKVKDPRKQRFNIRIIKGGASVDNIADPEGVIGAAVSYNYVYCAVVLEGPAGIGGTYRYKTLECPSSIG